jgi:Putative adhesin
MIRSAHANCTSFHRAALALLAVCSLTAALCYGVTKEVTKTYPLKADGTFDLSNVNGTVRIEVWDKEVVEVRAVKTTQDKESALDQVSIEVDAKPDALSISTRYPEEGGVEVAVDYTIHVPRHAHLNHLSTINGTLRLNEVEGIGDLHTVNGNIEIYGGSGNVHARTTNGNVYLEWKHASDAGSATAETTNGSVLLAIPANTRATLEARCRNGSFSSELPVVMQGEAEPRVLHGRIGRGGTPIHLGTVNGAIRVVELKAAI